MISSIVKNIPMLPVVNNENLPSIISFALFIIDKHIGMEFIGKGSRLLWCSIASYFDASALTEQIFTTLFKHVRCFIFV